MPGFAHTPVGPARWTPAAAVCWGNLVSGCSASTQIPRRLSPSLESQFQHPARPPVTHPVCTAPVSVTPLPPLLSGKQPWKRTMLVLMVMGGLLPGGSLSWGLGMGDPGPSLGLHFKLQHKLRGAEQAPEWSQHRASILPDKLSDPLQSQTPPHPQHETFDTHCPGSLGNEGKIRGCQPWAPAYPPQNSS